jgi:hypothetical protein
MIFKFWKFLNFEQFSNLHNFISEHFSKTKQFGNVNIFSITKNQKEEKQKKKAERQNRKKPTWVGPHPRGGVRRAVRADQVDV